LPAVSPALVQQPLALQQLQQPLAFQQPLQQPLAFQQPLQQPLAFQQPLQQPLALKQPFQQPLVQAAQPIQAAGVATFQAAQPAGITTQNIIGQPIYQAQAAPLQGFSQQQAPNLGLQQEWQSSQRFEPSGIPTAREAGNWNQLGEYGWYNRFGEQQYPSKGMASGMQQVTGQQLYQAEPILQQQGFNRAVSQQLPQGQQAGQASFAAAAATPQLASPAKESLAAAPDRNLNVGGYSWYNEQAGQTSTFAAQPLGQASSFAEPSSLIQGQASSLNQPMAASSFEQQAASSAASGFNQQMGQATSELGRASQSVGNIEGSLSRSMQAGSQFLQPSTAPIGTGAR